MKILLYPFKLLYEIISIFVFWVVLNIGLMIENNRIQRECLHKWNTVQNKEGGKVRTCTSCGVKQNYNSYYGRWKNRLL